MPEVKRIAYKFRIYPTPQQVAYLRDHWRTLRWLWNTTLRMRFDAWKRVAELYRAAEYTDDPERRAELLDSAKWFCQEFVSMWSPGNLGYQRQLTEARAVWPELASRSCDSEQMLLRDLDKAWQRWRDSVKGGGEGVGRPMFKKRHAPVTIATGKADGLRIEGELVRFPGMPKAFGTIQTVFHRPCEGTAKQARIIEGTERDWYLAISCEVPCATPVPHDGAVGIDRGVVNLAADSRGGIFAAPPPFTAGEEKTIKHVQRDASRKQKGSRRWRKAMLRKAKIEGRISRRRDHALHAIANHYADNFGTIVLEALQLRNMTASAKGTAEEPGSNVRQKAGLNRAILRAAPGRLGEFIKYKAAWQGGTVLEVSPVNTSRTCAECGHVDAASRPTQAEFACTDCGHTDHADVNAARNILARGVAGQVKVRRAAVKARTVKKERKAA